MKLQVLLLGALPMMAAMVCADESSFEKDRAAILGMAGEFRVGFNFHESYALTASYGVAEPYEEKAFEIVKVAEDQGKRIVLQHLLQVGEMTVKHWAQIWTYEDTEILEYQHGRIWKAVKVDASEAKGKWSQRVTQVDDTPRYEGIGAWKHFGESSEWEAVSNRPKPRREEDREDYDLLVVTNRQTVTPGGWYHEQDNIKQVRREGEDHPLCREVGFNSYVKVEGHDFTKANEYWAKTEGFWKTVRGFWDEVSPVEGSLRILAKSEEGRIFDVVDELVEKVEDGEAPGADEIARVLGGFIGEVDANP